MEYLKLILKRAFGPTWTIFGVVAGVVATVADAIWGEAQHVEDTARIVVVMTLLIIVLRLLFAPYQIWAEDQVKIKSLEKSDDDPLKTKKKRLSEASSGLLTSAKSIYSHWSVSDERSRSSFQSDYNNKRKRVNGLADGLLHQEDIYRAAQDAINRCDILIDDTMDGLSNRDNFTEAHIYTRNLLTLLAPDNGN